MQVHVLIINLQQRPERWQQIEQHLKQRELPFVIDYARVDAVSNPQHPGLGCMASHLKCLQIAKEAKWDQVLVLEDDAQFPVDAADRWTALTTSLPPKYNVVFGGCSQVRNLKKFNQHFAKLNSFSFATATHCMLYHARAYDELIRVLQKELTNTALPSHVDLVICNSMNQIYVAYPFLAYYYASPSDIRRNRNDNPESDQEQIRLAEEEVKLCLNV